MSNSFADFLKEQLRQKNWSASRLASQLSVDGGTVRAWIRGARVPSLKSPHVRKLAEVLKVPFEELEKYQIESLKQKSALSRRGREKQTTLDYAQPLIGVDNLTERIQVKDDRPKKNTGTIEGVENLAETSVCMLRELSEPQDDDRILITFQSCMSIFDKRPKLQVEWQKALEKAIEKGWKITHLIRLDSNYKRRTFEIVSNSFKFFKCEGHYEPCCFVQKTILMAPYGLILIPGKEALIALATDQNLTTDSAIYTRDKTQLKLITSHFKQLKTQTEPIFRQYKTYEQPDFVRAIINSDEEPGDRIIVTRRLSEITRPIEWYTPTSRWAKNLIEYLRKSSPIDTDLSNHIENRKCRAENLQRHLEIGKYFCRSIYPKSCIEKFINEGRSLPGYFQATKGERIEQLERILSLLKYEKYEMALVDEEQDDFFSKIKPSFCEVQGNHVFFMEFWHQKDEESHTSEWFLTQEIVVVRAFQEYLSKIWSTLPDKSKEKFYVSQWIEQKIKKLKMESDDS